MEHEFRNDIRFKSRIENKGKYIGELNIKTIKKIYELNDNLYLKDLQNEN
mgnify:CR=1 FL=1